MPGIIITLKTKAAEVSAAVQSLNFRLVAKEIDQLSAAAADVDFYLTAAESLEHLNQLLKKLDASAPAAVPKIIALENIPPEINLNLVDDFLVLPPVKDELLKRLQFHLQRQKTSQRIIQVGGLVLNCDSYEVTTDGRPVELTYKEFELLKFLMSQPKRVFHRRRLMEEIWDYDFFSGTRTVDVHVRRLRAKLGPKYGHHIKTVRHVGYLFR